MKKKIKKWKNPKKTRKKVLQKLSKLEIIKYQVMGHSNKMHNKLAALCNEEAVFYSRFLM